MRLNTAVLAATLALLILMAPLAADAQPQGKVPRIGILAPGVPPRPGIEALRQGLRDLGYREGHSIILEYRWDQGQPDQWRRLVAELIQVPVDVMIAAAGDPSVQAAKEATATVPIVMVSSHPVGTGLVASLARPGGNITGMAILSPELSSKRLELLKELVPALAQVAVLYDPAFPAAALDLAATQRAAQVLGVTLQVVAVHAPEEFEPAFASMMRERAEAVILLATPAFTAHRAQLVALAARHRLPAMYYWRDFVDEGGLIAYGPHLPDVFRRVASYVDKILKGARPSDLPVEQPTKFELIINLKTAKALGITIPPPLLFLADEVIQ